MKRRFLKMLGIALALGALLTAALMVTVVAQELRTPTYAYYGKVLNVDEFLALVEADTPLHCTPEYTATSMKEENIGSYTDLYSCFDTVDEAVSRADEQSATKADWEAAISRKMAAYGVSRKHSGGVGAPLSSWWDYYACSGWTCWSHQLSNGGSNSNHSGIWSILTTGSPNTTTIYMVASFGGFSYTYDRSWFALYQQPFGAGGGLSSRVN